jgi:hypothetical protein
MRFGGLILVVALALAGLAATGHAHLDGALAGWEGFAANLSSHRP